MRLERLSLEQFRLFERAELEPAPGLNLLLGGNGAGKTSVLEAIYLLAWGRSFRGGGIESLIRTGAEALRIFSLWRGGEPERLTRIGLERTARSWQARIDGEPVATLGELFRRCPVVCFEPGSHALLSGGGEQRRRYLDWGLFHVEPRLLGLWRRQQRALRQRNALLKRDPPDRLLEPWDQELAEAGQGLTALRQAYLDRIAPRLRVLAGQFLPELGEAALRFSTGWPESLELIDALVQARDRDRRLGHSSIGPQRADWRLGFAAHGGRETLSRGQQKLAALALLLVQAEDLAAARGEWPLLLLDDLPSELDLAHQELVWSWLACHPAQAWLTATEPPPGLAGDRVGARFHVEPSGPVRQG